MFRLSFRRSAKHDQEPEAPNADEVGPRIMGRLAHGAAERLIRAAKTAVGPFEKITVVCKLPDDHGGADFIQSMSTFVENSCAIRCVADI